MSGYRGPAEVVTQEGEVLASVCCQYRVSHSRVGLMSWQGRLSNPEPEYALNADQYQLRLPDGRQGTIIINRLRVYLF